MSTSSIEQSTRQLTGKRSHPAALQNSQSELDEDEILSDSEQSNLKRPKREDRNDENRFRRQDIGQFVDDEADEDKDEDVSDSDIELNDSDREKYRVTENTYQKLLNQDARQIVRQYENRAKIARRMTQRSFSAVPTLKDPKLFMVKCKIGMERELALSLGNKYVQLLKTDKSISPISACAIDKITGFIYVEAINKFQAQKACEGFNHLNSRYIRVWASLFWPQIREYI